MSNQDISSHEIKEIPSQAGIEKIDESSPTYIDKPFDPTKIDIIQKTLTIDLLIKRMKSDPMRIDLNTEFQRMGDLWDTKAQSRLIESLLVKIPLPAFYFDGTNDSNWLVVDGLQRLYSLKNFVIDKSLKLIDLEYLKQYNGKGFDELSHLHTRIEETQITAYIINPGTPPNVKYNIFKRINTGGLVLQSQEIRHALNQGIPADFIRELSEIEEFHTATCNLLRGKKRMEDRDFVTRFVGFYNGYYEYKPDLDTFLNQAMGSLAMKQEIEREQIKKDFIKAMKASVEIFDIDAFRKRYEYGAQRKPLNKALFEAWSVNLAKLTVENIRTLISNKESVKKAFIELMKTKEFERSITAGTGDPQSVKTRFDKIRELITGLI